MIIGRKEEIKTLREAYNSDYSKFVAIYGRRRVGKTFLVREAFDYKFAFSYAGSYNTTNKLQLKSFALALAEQGLDEIPNLKDWFEAFFYLGKLLREKPESKKVVFIDELPWMDAPKSSFLAAFEHFWNHFCAARKDILLIICGSATSWVLDNIVKNKGGLHNRLTYAISLPQFSLKECEEFVYANGMRLNRREIIEAYMVFGGVAYYWSLLDMHKSIAQNIDDLCFSSGGKLNREFEKLYASLFKRPEAYINIVTTLAKKKAGLTQSEIVEELKIISNGKFTKMLEDLEACGFIRIYQPFERKKRDSLYQLIDNFTLFHFQFLNLRRDNDPHFWTTHLNTSTLNSWEGIAFERICLLHSRQIKAALGISGISSSEYSWRETTSSKSEKGAQIDLLIDRADNVVSLCEIKYSTAPYRITKSDFDNLLNKSNRFSSAMKSRKTIHLLFITSNGIVDNEYSRMINALVDGEALFS